MAIHRPVHQEGLYFITFTCHRWLPLIELSDGYSAVYSFFHVLSQENHTVCAYVIMPNHLHLLWHYNGGEQSLNIIIGNGKRFMAYDFIARLKQKEQYGLLQQLQQAVKPKEKKRNKRHEVWIESFDVRECRTEKFILQKLICLHMNPISGKWKSADTSLDYLHSSAPIYFNGKQQLLPCRITAGL